ncbi:Uncharacterised protein [Serratia proteamaculans]|nr:Uncharacterised protein [Serratia proteamaculans]CAI2538324.1 Uncharacterised protein [Serratia proteamaculans]
MINTIWGEEEKQRLQERHTAGMTPEVMIVNLNA